MQIPLDAMEIVNAEMLIENVAAALCMRLIECGQLDPTRLDACKEIERAAWAQAFELDPEIQSGRLHINDAVCKAYLATARCDGTDDGRVYALGPCSNGLLVPMVAPGNACRGSVECVSGYCDHVDGGAIAQGCKGGTCRSLETASSTDRRCTPVLGFLGECDSLTSFCNINPALCTGAATDPTCYNRDGGLCVPFSADNMPCGTAGCETGAFCNAANTCIRPTGSGALNDVCEDAQSTQTTHPACGDGLYCSHANTGDVAQPGTCLAKIPAGHPCNPNDVLRDGLPNNTPCVDGTSCYTIAEDPSPSPFCRPLGLPTGVTCPGGNPNCHACNPSVVIPTCGQTLFCRPTDSTHGVCDPMPVGGASCTVRPPPGVVTCLNNLLVGALPADELCEPNTPGSDAGTCNPIKNAGDSCTPSIDNLSGVHACFFGGLQTTFNPFAPPAICGGSPSTCKLVCP
jgi:hypothetical protein